MRRRALLTTLGAVVAGCSSRRGTEPTASGLATSPETGMTTTPPQTSTSPTPDRQTTPPLQHLEVGESFESDTWAVSIEEVSVRESFVFWRLDTMDVAGSDGQFLLVNVAAANPRIDVGWFTLEVGDRFFGGTSNPGGIGIGPGSIVGVGDRYVGTRPEGWFGFELPAEIDATHADIRLSTPEGDAVWTLDDDVAAELSEPAPEFELRSVDVPDRTGEERRIDVSVTAANVGERTETFRGCLNVDVFHREPIELELEPDEEATWTDQASAPDVPQVGVQVLTVAGDRTNVVRTQEADTGTSD